MTISWLDRLSGAILRYLAADMPQRGTIEFVGAGVVVTDNAANDKTVVTISGAAGTVDLTADVTGVLPIANGGTGSAVNIINPAIVAVPAFNIDWSAGDVFTKTLSGGADTLTFSNIGVLRKTIILHLTGAGGTVALPTMLWPGGVVPTQTPSGKDTYTFVWDGTDVRATALQAFA